MARLRLLELGTQRVVLRLAHMEFYYNICTLPLALPLTLISSTDAAGASGAKRAGMGEGRLPRCVASKAKARALPKASRARAALVEVIGLGLGLGLGLGIA